MCFVKYRNVGFMFFSSEDNLCLEHVLHDPMISFDFQKKSLGNFFFFSEPDFYPNIYIP